MECHRKQVFYGIRTLQNLYSCIIRTTHLILKHSILNSLKCESQIELKS